MEVVDFVSKKILFVTRSRIYKSDLLKEVSSFCKRPVKEIALSDGKEYIKDENIENLKKIYVFFVENEIIPFSEKNINEILLGKQKISEYLYKGIRNIYKEIDIDSVIYYIDIVLYNKGLLKMKPVSKNSEYKKNEIVDINVIKKIFGYPLNYSLITANLVFKANIKADIEEIVKTIKLGKNIPVVLSKKSGLRVLKDFPKSKVDEWFKDKKLKGVTFRIKGGDTKNDYYLASISDVTSKLVLRLNFKKPEEITFEKLPEIVCTGLKELSRKIENIISFENISIFKNISYSVVQISSKIYFEDTQIKGVLKDFDKVFSVVPDSKGFLKLNYPHDKNIVLIFKNTADEKGNYLRLVEISGLSVYSDINYLFYNLSLLLDKAKDKKIMKLTKKGFEERTVVQKQKEIKVKQDIKIMNQKGLNIDTVSCQKKRQPVIYDPEKHKNEKISYLIDTNVKDTRVFCRDTNDYIYPGYTSRGSICCFVKDQREKPVFLKYNSVGNSNKKFIVTVTDKKMINSFKTKLTKGRLGCIPEHLKTAFEGLVRVGLGEDLKDSLYHKYNVVVISETEKDFFKCKILKPYDFIYKNTIFVIDRESSVELLIKFKSLSDFKYIFDRETVEFKRFMKVYEKACEVKFDTKRLLPNTFADFINKGILSQIVDNNVVYYLEVKNLGIVPIIPRPPVKQFKKTEYSSMNFLGVKEQYNLLKNNNFEVTGISKTSNPPVLVLQNGLGVPVKLDSSSKLPEIVYGDYIKNEKENDIFSIEDKDEKEYLRLRYIFSRKVLGSKQKEYTTEELKKILEDETVSDENLYRLKMESLWNKNIFKGLVYKERKNDKNYIIRDDEILLATPEEIEKFFDTNKL